MTPCCWWWHGFSLTCLPAATPTINTYVRTYNSVYRYAYVRTYVWRVVMFPPLLESSDLAIESPKINLSHLRSRGGSSKLQLVCSSSSRSCSSRGFSWEKTALSCTLYISVLTKTQGTVYTYYYLQSVVYSQAHKCKRAAQLSKSKAVLSLASSSSSSSSTVKYQQLEAFLKVRVYTWRDGWMGVRDD